MRELIHLYGPFSINSFGLILIVGLYIFSFLIVRDPKRAHIITVDEYYKILALSIIVGLLGGRLLFVASQWDSFESWWDIGAFWQGGFSLLGSICALVIFIPLYCKKYKIPTIQFLDLIAIYAPLLQAISRLGCFFAGCCFGVSIKNTFLPVSLQCFKTHPTQLYSAITLFFIFLGMHFFFNKFLQRPGQLFCIYLLLISAERFIIDFWRADREFVLQITIFSLAQLIALALMSISVCGLLYSSFTGNKKRS